MSTSPVLDAAACSRLDVLVRQLAPQVLVLLKLNGAAGEVRRLPRIHDTTTAKAARVALEGAWSGASDARYHDEGRRALEFIILALERPDDHKQFAGLAVGAAMQAAQSSLSCGHERRWPSMVTAAQNALGEIDQILPRLRL